MTRDRRFQILTLLLLAAGVVGGYVIGKRVTAVAVTASVTQDLAVFDEVEGKIMAAIVERNPQATIKDFVGFPRIILAESARTGLDFRIVLALIDKESEFNPRAVGRAGEVGLMQVLPATAALVAQGMGMQFTAPTRAPSGGYSALGTLGNPADNVRIGCAYLRDQVSKFGPTPTALRAYNRGETNARQNRPDDRYAEDIGLRLVAFVHAIPR